MIKGLYTAASAMLANKQDMNIIANNIANAGTNSYKREGVVQKTFSDMLISCLEKNKSPRQIGYIGTGVSLSQSYTNFQSGDLEYTGGKLDLALKGRGFFEIKTSAGKAYTRNGNFTVNDKGHIVNQDGCPLLNKKGKPIQTLTTRELNIDEYGRLYFGELKGSTINIVDFKDYTLLEKRGDNNYQVKENSKMEPEAADNCTVMSGYLEKSNVNIIKEMTNMIKATRLYETNQKIIQSMDNTLDKAVNQIGRTG